MDVANSLQSTSPSCYFILELNLMISPRCPVLSVQTLEESIATD